MGQSASQAAAFYRDVAESKTLWTVQDDGGVPAPPKSNGQRAMPFWSSLSRVRRIIRTVPAYAALRPLEVSWTDFCTSWGPDLARDGLLVGVNWSGANAVGYDLAPQDVIANVAHHLHAPGQRRFKSEAPSDQ